MPGPFLVGNDRVIAPGRPRPSGPRTLPRIPAPGEPGPAASVGTTAGPSCPGPRRFDDLAGRAGHSAGSVLADPAPIRCGMLYSFNDWANSMTRSEIVESRIN